MRHWPVGGVVLVGSVVLSLVQELKMIANMMIFKAGIIFFISHVLSDKVETLLTIAKARNAEQE
jgi:hypothetical protein